MSKSRAKGHSAVQSGLSRQRLAYEVARLMWEDSIEDFKLAKDKAVKRLGVRHAELPNNREIARELKAYSTLFASESTAELRVTLLQVAEKLMRHLQLYTPRLAGFDSEIMLARNISLRLHIFCDQTEHFDLYLQERGIEYEFEDKRFRYGLEDYVSSPTYLFDFEAVAVQVSVFPTVARNRVPLSAVDGRPMQRLSVKEVEAMLG